MTFCYSFIDNLYLHRRFFGAAWFPVEHLRMYKITRNSLSKPLFSATDPTINCVKHELIDMTFID